MYVAIGTTTADLLVTSPASFASLSGGDGFRTSNLVFTGQPLILLMGGNGGNSAYVWAGLGLPTALGGAVGRDPLGDLLVGWLEARQVDLSALLRSEQHATSSSTIIASQTTEQVVFHHLGATQALSLTHIPESLLAEAEVLLASSFSFVPQMRPDGFAQALAITHRAGGLTALDIGPALGEPVRLAELQPLLPHVDYLLANTHELSLVVGEQDWAITCDRLLDAGARAVVVKRGEQGASLRSQEEAADVPAFAVKANISVGAGDAFNAGFLYGARQGWPPEEALRFGNAVAALTVASDRGVLGSPGMAEVEAFLKRK